MNRTPGLLRGLKWLGWTLLALLLLLLAAAAALDLGYFRTPVVKLLTAAAGRPIRVEGALRLHTAGVMRAVEGRVAQAAAAQQ